jgi:hypothetical protein
MFVRGKGFKTQYYGGTKAAAMISQLTQLGEVMHTAFANKAFLSGVRKDFKALRQRWKEETDRNSPSPLTAIENLLELLPGREEVDAHVKKYLQIFETTYRILHQPSFQREYQSFWTDPANRRDGFVIILLLIHACVDCEFADAATTFVGTNPTTRNRAVHFINTCTAWLEKQSHKHLTVTSFQVRCLLYLARRVNAIKEKRNWMEACSLMTFAMSTGLHRDPWQLCHNRYALTQGLHSESSHKSKVSISPFEAELRRRLWVTIMEWEIQASMERGMPSMLSGYVWDSECPGNIRDEDFDEGTTKKPLTRDDDEFTSSFYTHHSYRSVRFRINLLSELNDPEFHVSFSDLLKYEEKIKAELEAIPMPIEESNLNTAEELSARSMLKLQLLDYLILIHSPFVEKSSYSTYASISAASQILDIHDQLAKNGVHVFTLIRNDVFRSALAICHHIMISKPLKSKLYFYWSICVTICHLYSGY